MPYAETADVLARAGRFSKAWTETSTPSFDDIERILAARAAEIDAGLLGRGITPPATATPALALKSLNAAGALISLLGASALGAASDAVDALYTRVQAEWDAGMEAIRTGTHAAVVAIETAGSSPETASDFWSDEPGYGLEGWIDSESNPYLAPDFARAEPF